MKKTSIFSLALLVLLPFSALSSTSLNVESGQAFNAYNKVKIDGEKGSLFNIAPALDNKIYYRLSLIYKFNSRHGMRLLYAPLKFNGEKEFSKDINLNGVNFPANQGTEAQYQFNSYRGS